MTAPHVLLMTDLVDSTAWAQRLDEAALVALWQAHDDNARRLLARHRGREIDKSDGFLLLFEQPADALAFAQDYHAALAALPQPCQARAALHLGPLSLRPNDPAAVAQGAKPLEVDGLAKPVTARLLGLALGGQTLLSDAARHALAGELPDEACCAHGHWRFQGVLEPLAVHEALRTGQAPRPPADGAKAYRVVQGEDGHWLPHRPPRHSLPAERDAFVGRQADLQALWQAGQTGARLLTLVGPGGAGKTRLALRHGWTWLGEHPGGVWFCDLSPARGPDGIVHAVAQGLDLPLGPGDPVAQVGTALAARGTCLLVLDNFEQVREHAAATLGLWLDQAPAARALVTSRELLGLPGEVAVPLAPLPDDEAVALFLQRAQAAAASGLDQPAEQQAVQRLVQLLDGLPLAVELAAARVRIMPPSQLLARMGERFRLLVSSGGGRPDRQATLRATLDWSWSLLAEPERAALAQWSVFEGGFTLAAAEAVLDLSACGEDTPWALDLLQALVDQSLLRRMGDERFDMLVSVHAYAAEQLRREGACPGSGPAGVAATQQRHARHFGSLSEREAVAGRCVELDNLSAACLRAAARQDGPGAVRLLELAWEALRLRGPFRHGMELAQMVASCTGQLGAAERARVAAVRGAALLAMGRGLDANPVLKDGVRLVQEAGRGDIEARLLCVLGQSEIESGQSAAARQTLARARDLACHAGDQLLLCWAETELGALAQATSDVAGADEHFRSALEQARQLGDKRREAGLLSNLGVMAHMKGLLDEAEPLYQEALRLATESADRRCVGNVHCNLGQLLHDRGCVAQAIEHFGASATAARELGQASLEAAALCNLALTQEAQGRKREALANCQRAVELVHRTGQRRAEGQYRGYLARLLVANGHLGDATTCWQLGERLLREAADPISLAVLLGCAAEVEHLAGRPIEARRLLVAAVKLSEGAQTSIQSEAGLAAARARATMEINAIETNRE